MPGGPHRAVCSWPTHDLNHLALEGGCWRGLAGKNGKRTIMNGADATQEPIDLTVAITCYNEAEFIIDTIESVVAALQQTPLKYEIIIIDDRSSDGSVERIREHIRSF